MSASDSSRGGVGRTVRLSLGAALVCACSRQGELGLPEPTLPETIIPLGERLANEASRIPNLIAPDELLIVGLYTFSAILVARAASAAVHGFWRLGFDADRRLGRWVVFSKIALGLVVAYAVLRRFVEAAPILSGGAIVVFAAVGLTTIRGTLENLAVGIDLAFRHRFRPGDRVVVAEYSGTVREIGLTGVHLRSSEGTTVFIPNRLLNEHAVLVTRAENTARVVVEIRGVGELAADSLERIRRTALLSPYRSIGTTVRADVRADGTVEVEIQAQSSLLVADAETQLAASVRSMLSEDQVSKAPREV